MCKYLSKVRFFSGSDQVPINVIDDFITNKVADYLSRFFFLKINQVNESSKVEASLCLKLFISSPLFGMKQIVKDVCFKCALRF